MDQNDQSDEAKIQAMGLTASRVTPADINALMDRVAYIVDQPAGTTSTLVHALLDGRFLLASGHSACVSPENFNAQLGIDMARKKAEAAARDKLWESEGYRLFIAHSQTPQPVAADGGKA